MKEEEVDKELLKLAKKDRKLISKLSYDFNKKVSMVMRWIGGDIATMPPAFYESIKTWFKNK